MGKVCDMMAESIFLYKQDCKVAPKSIKAGKDAFEIICFENGLTPSFTNNTY